MDMETFRKQVKKSYKNWLTTGDTYHLKDIYHLVIDKEIADIMESQRDNPSFINYNGRNIEILNTADHDGREGW